MFTVYSGARDHSWWGKHRPGAHRGGGEGGAGRDREQRDAGGRPQEASLPDPHPQDGD